MLPVSLDCSLLISPSVFSNVYLISYVLLNYDKKKHNMIFVHLLILIGVRVVVFNATVNSISVISWRSFVYTEET